MVGRWPPRMIVEDISRSSAVSVIATMAGESSSPTASAAERARYHSSKSIRPDFAVKTPRSS